MRKSFVVLLSLLLVCFALAGCAGPASDPTNTAATDPNGSTATNPVTQAGSLSESYATYMEMKGAMLVRLSAGLSESQPMASLNILGISMIDLALLPLTVFGMDEAGIEASLSMMSATDIDYHANGNSYTMTYTDSEGISTLFETTYDPAKESVSTKVSQSGSETIIFEYIKTSFGYASQYYTKNDDGTFSLYKSTFYNGSDGVVGITNSTTSQPASLINNANISKDFPKDCASWYAVEGASGTGMNEDGTTFEFTVPAATSAP